MSSNHVQNWLNHSLNLDISNFLSNPRSSRCEISIKSGLCVGIRRDNWIYKLCTRMRCLIAKIAYHRHLVIRAGKFVSKTVLKENRNNRRTKKQNKGYHGNRRRTISSSSLIPAWTDVFFICTVRTV